MQLHRPPLGVSRCSGLTSGFRLGYDNIHESAGVALVLEQAPARVSQRRGGVAVGVAAAGGPLPRALDLMQQPVNRRRASQGMLDQVQPPAWAEDPPHLGQRRRLRWHRAEHQGRHNVIELRRAEGQKLGVGGEQPGAGGGGLGGGVAHVAHVEIERDHAGVLAVVGQIMARANAQLQHRPGHLGQQLAPQLDQARLRAAGAPVVQARHMLNAWPAPQQAGGGEGIFLHGLAAFCVQRRYAVPWTSATRATEINYHEQTLILSTQREFAEHSVRRLVLAVRY